MKRSLLAGGDVPGEEALAADSWVPSNTVVRIGDKYYTKTTRYVFSPFMWIGIQMRQCMRSKAERVDDELAEQKRDAKAYIKMLEKNIREKRAEARDLVKLKLRAEARAKLQMVHRLQKLKAEVSDSVEKTEFAAIQSWGLKLAPENAKLVRRIAASNKDALAKTSPDEVADAWDSLRETSEAALEMGDAVRDASDSTDFMDGDALDECEAELEAMIAEDDLEHDSTTGHSSDLAEVFATGDMPEVPRAPTRAVPVASTAPPRPRVMVNA